VRSLQPNTADTMRFPWGNHPNLIPDCTRRFQLQPWKKYESTQILWTPDFASSAWSADAVFKILCQVANTENMLPYVCRCVQMACVVPARLVRMIAFSAVALVLERCKTRVENQHSW
jgi:hypothetical protein